MIADRDKTMCGCLTEIESIPQTNDNPTPVILPDWNTADDAQLVTACLDGNERAWELLLARYDRLIYAIPLRFGFSQLHTQEIFQEVCVTLLEKLDTLRNHRRIQPWIVTVTRRLCIQRLRMEKPARQLDSLEFYQADEQTLDERLLAVEQKQLVLQALNTLDPRCQALLRALFFETPVRPYNAIASELKMGVTSIGPTRARCLEKLRQAMQLLEI
jgi:RNA polymerase sigma factor (sigma-70 family)